MEFAVMSATEISYPCKFDNSLQPAICRFSPAAEPRPLVVALHTWSFDHSKNYQTYIQEAEKWDWNLIFPKFRGPNNTPEGCGSDLVVSDLEDAVTYMKKVCNVDPNRVYLTGGSGGGHCSLLLAGRRPDLWTAVSSWCPISDIGAWHAQCKGGVNAGYAAHIESACGGDPAVSESARVQSIVRSPLTWLANAREAGLTIDNSTGIHDGHTGSVPVSQALNAFNVLADEKDRFTSEEISYMVKEEKIFPGLEYTAKDPAFGTKFSVLLRRQSARARMTLFEGGHNIFPAIAFEWLSRQIKGKAPDWRPGSAVETGNGELSK